MLLFKISGPTLPKPLGGHSSLTQGNNLIILGGGYFTGEDFASWQNSDSIYKLSCNNGEFTWEEMDVKLKTARYYFVADFVQN